MPMPDSYSINSAVESEDCEPLVESDAGVLSSAKSHVDVRFDLTSAKKNLIQSNKKKEIESLIIDKSNYLSVDI